MKQYYYLRYDGNVYWVNNYFLGILQLCAKKRYVYAAMAFIWTVIPAIEATFTVTTTDIVNGKCTKFALYQSYAAQKTLGFVALFLSYLMPLALMIFCYVRIIRALRSQVILVP